MQIESFLKFYTAFVEDKSQAQSIDKNLVEISEKKSSTDTLATVLRADKLGQDAKVYSH